MWQDGKYWWVLVERPSVARGLSIAHRFPAARRVRTGPAARFCPQIKPSLGLACFYACSQPSRADHFHAPLCLVTQGCLAP